MKLFKYGKDGGPESTVWGFWLCEFKSLFSIAILCFEDGSREAYHTHAFNSISWVLKGSLVEKFLGVYWPRLHRPSIKPVITKRWHFHRVTSVGRTYVLTFRGPWSKTWKEYLPQENKFIILAEGRKQVNEY